MRVIYYCHNERLPVFLPAAYGKNEKANLSMADRNAMKRLIPGLVAGEAFPMVICPTHFAGGTHATEWFA